MTIIRSIFVVLLIIIFNSFFIDQTLTLSLKSKNVDRRSFQEEEEEEEKKMIGSSSMVQCQGDRYPNENKCLSYQYGNDSIQVIDCHLPKQMKRSLLVLMVHGGYWDSKINRSVEDNVANDLLFYGLVVCNLDYRSVGNQGGYPNTFYDLSNASDILPWIGQKQGFQTDRVIVVGHSAGGQLGGFICGRFRLKAGQVGFSQNPLRPIGFVSQAGVNNMWDACDQYKQTGNGAVLRFLGGSYHEYPNRYLQSSLSASSQLSIRSLYPSQYLPLNIRIQSIVGSNDETVPLFQTVDFAQQSIDAGDQCDLLIVQGDDHFAHLNSSSKSWNKTRQFILSFS